MDDGDPRLCAWDEGCVSGYYVYYILLYDINIYI